MTLPKTPAPNPSPFMLAGIGLIVLAAGCGSGPEVVSMMDQASRERLEAIPLTTTIVLSCRGDSLAGDLGIPTYVHELARTPDAVLVEVLHRDLSRLDTVGGIRRAAVWGPAGALARLGPDLRTRVLAAWAVIPEEPLTLLAVFGGPGDGLRAELTTAGADVRTVAGPVVTLAATPETIFRILALPGLVRLQAPRRVEPLTGP